MEVIQIVYFGAVREIKARSSTFARQVSVWEKCEWRAFLNALS